MKHTYIIELEKRIIDAVNIITEDFMMSRNKSEKDYKNKLIKGVDMVCEQFKRSNHFYKYFNDIDTYYGKVTITYELTDFFNRTTIHTISI